MVFSITVQDTKGGLTTGNCLIEATTCADLTVIDLLICYRLL